MSRRLSKKSKFLLDKLQKTIAVAKKAHDKDLVDQITKVEEEINQFLEPKKSKFFKLAKKQRKFKKKIIAKNGHDPKIIARRLNGRKGGDKTAALYDRETREQWGSKAGSSTLQRYGRDFFKHIRKKRKKYPRHKK